MLPPCRIDPPCMRIQTFIAECSTGWAMSRPYACMYVCMHICKYVYMYVYKETYLCISTCTLYDMYVGVFTCTYMYVGSGSVCVGLDFRELLMSTVNLWHVILGGSEVIPRVIVILYWVYRTCNSLTINVSGDSNPHAIWFSPSLFLRIGDVT